MSDQIYDKGYKRIFDNSDNFLHFIKKYIKLYGTQNIQASDLIALPTKRISNQFRNSESDIVYFLNNKEYNIVFYVLLELQSYVDYSMPYRLLVYMADLIQYLYKEDEKNGILVKNKSYKLPSVVPIVLYNGKSKWTATRKFHDYVHGSELFTGNSIDFEYVLIELEQLTDELLLETNTVLDNIFALDKSRDKSKLMQILRTVFQRSQLLSEKERKEISDFYLDVLRNVIPETERDMAEKLSDAFLKGDEKYMEYAIERVFKDEREEGKREGEIEVTRNLVKKMFHANIQLKTIMEVTGLSEAEIEAIKVDGEKEV